MTQGKRYIIEMLITEVDEQGDSIDTVEHSRSLLATTNLVALKNVLAAIENLARSALEDVRELSVRDKIV